MKKKMMVIACSLLLAMPFLSFAEEKKVPDPNVSAVELANENVKFKRNRSVFNNKANKEKRAERLAKKKAAEAKKKADAAQDKGEGQVKVKF